MISVMIGAMKIRLKSLLVLSLSLLLVQSPPLSSTNARADARFFPETGKSISGAFLDYWQSHGGLEQQGYPLSEPLTEKSDRDRKVYTVQYFELSVFEAPPENAAPYDVLLSLLGTLLYK